MLRTGSPRPTRRFDSSGPLPWPPAGPIVWRSTCRCWSAGMPSACLDVTDGRRSRRRRRRGHRDRWLDRPAAVRRRPARRSPICSCPTRRSNRPGARRSRILPVAPVETEKEKTSGFEADLGSLFVIDRFRIDGLSPPYLKRIRLEGSGDRARWTVLVGEGTVFDLPDSRLRQTELSFAAGSYRYLRVTWDDARSARVAQAPACRGA